MLCSLEEGTLWTESCPRLRATIATALNLLRVPVLGLLAFCRFRRSSVLRLTPPRWSVHTKDTCILTFDRLTKLKIHLIKTPLWFNQAENSQRCEFSWRAWHSSVWRMTPLRIQRHAHTAPLLGITVQSLNWLSSSQCSEKTGAAGWADQNVFKLKRSTDQAKTKSSLTKSKTKHYSKFTTTDFHCVT